MYRKIAILVLTVLILLVNVTAVQADKPVEKGGKGTGFDGAGYNDNAHIFNGTYGQWCMDKFPDQETWCKTVYGAYWNDKLIMKWNAEWERGNIEGWKDTFYNARLSNISHGRLPDGSGEKSLYKIVWVGPCIEGADLPTGGYCIWGQFAVIMDKFKGDGKVEWIERAKPAGYGYYFQKPE